MKALLIIGSPKGKKSTSYSLGRRLTRRLEEAGWEVEELVAAAVPRSAEERQRLCRTADAADLIVASFPLYVDQLPAPLVQALELVADHRKGAAVDAAPAGAPRVQKVAAIVQCGFPETIQNRPAVDILRLFALEAGFQWAGALALGMGGTVGGRPLQKSGGLLRSVVQAIDMAAASLAAGGDIPEAAAGLMARPLMPRWLYHLAANWGFRSRLKKNGVAKRAHDRPFA
jgi:putative NADPH-quinone reductase